MGDFQLWNCAAAAVRLPAVRPTRASAARVFLAQLGYVTGQILVVDSGRGVKIDRLDELTGEEAT
jgi:hypothetical protein